MFPKNLDSLFVARGLTIAGAVATLFGTVWVVEGINALHIPSLFTLPLFVVLGLCTFVLTIACIRLLTTSSLFPPYGDKLVIKQVSMYVNIATVIQILASMVGPTLLSMKGRGDLALPATILSVGLYLLALAPALRVPHYYIVGGLLSAIPVISFLFVPETMLIAGATFHTWMFLNGIVCGLVFLADALTNMVLTVRIRRNQYRPNQSKREPSSIPARSYTMKLHVTAQL